MFVRGLHGKAGSVFLGDSLCVLPFFAPAARWRKGLSHGEKSERGDPPVGSFHIRKTVALRASVHHHDGVHFHLRCGGRSVRVQFCGEGVLRRNQSCHALHYGAGRHGLHDRNRRHGVGFQDHGAGGRGARQPDILHDDMGHGHTGRGPDGFGTCFHGAYGAVSGRR